MKTGITTRIAGVASAVAIALSVAGCGHSTKPAVPGPTPSRNIGSIVEDPMPGVYVDAHISVTVDLKTGETLERGQSNSLADSFALLDRNQVPEVEFSSFPASQRLPYTDTGLGNGRYGIYRNTADIPADEAAQAVHVPTALGDATVFSYPFYVCTNSCRHFDVPAAVITLDHPVDPDHPALVVYADDGQLDVSGLRALLARIHIRPGAVSLSS